METERLPIWRALPILSSGSLSSVAYGPEAGHAILATAGAAVLPEHVAIVPLLDMGPAGRRAPAYAVALGTEVIAIHVETSEDEPSGEDQPIAERLRTWQRRAANGARPGQVQLVVIDSPYRSVVGPPIAYMDNRRRGHVKALLHRGDAGISGGSFVDVRSAQHRGFWLKAALLTRVSVAARRT